MDSSITNSPLSEIANRLRSRELIINTETEMLMDEIACSPHAQMIADNVYLQGLDLLDAKRQLKHGQFKTWISANFFPFAGSSYTTAARYMRVFRQFQKYGRVPAVPKTMLYELADKTFTDDDRSHALALSDAGKTGEIRVLLDTPRKQIDALAQQAAEKARMMFESAPQEVRELCVECNVTDTEAIEMLWRISNTFPDEFAAIQKDKLVRYEPLRDGEQKRPTPLITAKASNIAESYRRMRQVQSMSQGEESKPDEIARGGCTVVEVSEEFNYVTIRVSQSTKNKLAKYLNTELSIRVTKAVDKI